jgi:hypothetical protein
MRGRRIEDGTRVPRFLADGENSELRMGIDCFAPSVFADERMD